MYSGKRRLKNLNFTNNLLGVHSKHRTSFKKIHFPFSTMKLAVDSGLKIIFSILNWKNISNPKAVFTFLFFCNGLYLHFPQNT